MAFRPSRKPRTVVKNYPDGDRRKRSPNGVRSTFLSIQYYWRSLVSGEKQDEHLTPAVFCSEFGGGFEKVFDKTFDRYPAMKFRPESLHRLLQQITSGRHNIEFVHLLSFAEYVGLPLSLFMLFTQMVSDEKRLNGTPIGFRPSALQTLQRIRSVIELAERHIAEAAPNEKIFIHEYDEFDEPGVILAKAQALKSWSDLYSSLVAQDAVKEPEVSPDLPS